MSEARPISTLWSDEQLDAALGELHRDRPVNTAALPSMRAAVLAAAADVAEASSAARPVREGFVPLVRAAVEEPAAAAGWFSGGRRWTRRIGAVAVAAVLVAAALLVPSMITDHGRPVVSAEAAQALTNAAGAIGSSDAPVKRGQYRYLQTHAWWAAFQGPDVRLVENVTTIWVPADPADPSQKWMLRRAPTGAVRWIHGDQADADTRGSVSPTDLYPTINAEAACGDFYSAGGCDRPGSWQDPTPAFLAALPRKPVALLARLRADAPDNGNGDAELLVYTADLLKTGLVPADLRAALYQALAGLPGLEITDRQANLDGRVGMALGMQDGQSRQDIIIDPATGSFIGERQVLTDDMDGAPAGTALSSTSLTTAVVNQIGATP